MNPPVPYVPRQVPTLPNADMKLFLRQELQNIAVGLSNTAALTTAANAFLALPSATQYALIKTFLTAIGTSSTGLTTGDFYFNNGVLTRVS